jgi:Fur family zinc uptake transcriptional regulator
MVTGGLLRVPPVGAPLDGKNRALAALRDKNNVHDHRPDMTAHSTARPAVIEHREHDHARCATDALAHAEAICRREGLRFTEQRRHVLQALLESHVPASAYDVIERLAGHGEPRLAPVSVYRALEFLTENNFAHRIESMNAYVACDRGDDCEPGATLFLICDSCGAAAEAPSDAMGTLLAREVKQRGFAPRRPVLEVRGLCARCRAA